MNDIDYAKFIKLIKEGQLVPYLGPGALSGAVHKNNGNPIPADSESLILAMNDGQAVAPKLMYEFPRAAMNRELKKGRNAVTRFLTDLYNNDNWSRSPVHEWLAGITPNYVIDINRDLQLQTSYNNTPHTLVCGVARIAGTDYRFKIYQYDGESYTEITQEAVSPTLPILFKPMGTPHPTPNYIASDADYVDYITELMGGFAIPDFLKAYRKNKQYLFIGMRFTRDTERMVMSDITYNSQQPAGWAFIPEPTKKEVRYCAKQGIEIIETSFMSFVNQTRPLGEKSISAA